MVVFCRVEPGACAAAAGEVAACAAGGRCGAGGGGDRRKPPHAVAEHGPQQHSYNGARGCRPLRNETPNDNIDMPYAGNYPGNKCIFADIYNRFAMKKRIKVHDKEFEIFISSRKIQKTIDKMADVMKRELKDKNPLFLVVLNGAFIFAADLIRRMDFDCEVSFVKLSSYVGTQTTSTVRELIGLDEVLTGRTVVIVEDIIDTGITMANTIPKLKKLQAADVKLAALLFKPDAFQMDYKIDYVGMEIPNDFIVGYGLDYDGLARNYAEIYKIREQG